MTDTTAEAQKTYLWCDHDKRSFRHHEAQDGACPICGRTMSPVGKTSAILRGLMANELVASDIPTKHRQLIRLIWTRHNQGQQYYKLLAPDMPYSRFEARVTDLICRGSAEGWVRIVFPPSPSADESLYRIEFADESRFIAELESIAAATPS